MKDTQENNDGADYIMRKAKERLAGAGIHYQSISWGQDAQRYTLMVETGQGRRWIRFGSLSFNAYDQPATQALIQAHLTLLINKLK